MTSPRMTHWMRTGAGLLALAAVAVVGACNDDGAIIGNPSGFDPELIAATPRWIESHWEGRDAVGTMGVDLLWELPDDWDGEVFRVYARPGGNGDYLLIATVTACISRQCTYTDINVQPDRTYDYFVTAFDERRNRELGSSTALRVTLPPATLPTMPAPLDAVGLDNAVFLRWEGSEDADHYRIFLEREDADSLFFEIGATDGIGYLDTRAANGTEYLYRVAAVSADGYISRRSDGMIAIPRPDYHAEIIYPLADSAQASGFRFTAVETDNPIVPGTAATAQWRLESGPSGLQIVPTGQTRVTSGVFTTALVCGPGSDADCQDIPTAPVSSAFGTGPVAVSTGNTYVFEVVDGGLVHFAKIRVQGDGADASGRSVMVFDWAYQLVPDEPSLDVAPLSFR